MTMLTSYQPQTPTPAGLFTDPAHLADRFLHYADIRSNTLRNYGIALRSFFDFMRKNEIAVPSRETVIAWRDFLLETVKPTTCKMYLSALKVFSGWLDAEGLYRDFARHIRPPKTTDGHKRDALTAEQAAVLIRTAEPSEQDIISLRNYAIIRLMLACGLRDIEVSRADVSDLTQKAGKSILFVWGKGRNSADKYVIIPDSVYAAIQAYLMARRRNNIISNVLFCGHSNKNHGQRMTTRNISGIVKALLKKSGYNSPRLSAHSLRHTFATIALSAGSPLNQIRDGLRHRSVSTTEIYLHEQNEFANPVSRSVDSILSEKLRRI